MCTRKIALTVVVAALAAPLAQAMEPERTPPPAHAPATEQELQKLTRVITWLHAWCPTQELASKKDHEFWLTVSGMQLMGDILHTHGVYSGQRKLIRMGLLGHMLEQMFLQQRPVVDQAKLDKAAQDIVATKLEGNICPLEEALIQEMAVPLFGWLKQHLQ